MLMDNLPVEVIGQILSRIGCIQDAVIASGTCRQWREAFHKHLHAISVRLDRDKFAYHELTIAQIALYITKILYQTTRLQDLSIVTGHRCAFPASIVVAWLMHSRKTLRQLDYDVRTCLDFDVLDIFGGHKLESLNLSNYEITVVKPEFHKFLYLRSLCLCYVSIPTVGLKLLVNACPRLESLKLVNIKFDMLTRNATVKLNSPTLKTFIIEDTWVGSCTLKADNIEYLHLENCEFNVFELLGKGSLKHFKMERLRVVESILIGEGVLDNLEILEVYRLTYDCPNVCQMISRSSKLRRLQLKHIYSDSEDGVIVDFKTVALCFPQLGHLSLGYDVRNTRWLRYDFEGCYSLKNVVVLEVNCVDLDKNFLQWIEELLGVCLYLKQLIIDVSISYFIKDEECQMLAECATSMVQLIKKYTHVDLQFKYRVK